LWIRKRARREVAAAYRPKENLSDVDLRAGQSRHLKYAIWDPRRIPVAGIADKGMERVRRFDPMSPERARQRAGEACHEDSADAGLTFGKAVVANCIVAPAAAAW
jgi:hypothetical protein